MCCATLCSVLQNVMKENGAIDFTPGMHNFRCYPYQRRKFYIFSKKYSPIFSNLPGNIMLSPAVPREISCYLPRFADYYSQSRRSVTTMFSIFKIKPNLYSLRSQNDLGNILHAISCGMNMPSRALSLNLNFTESS